jgi:hypothetical protein
MDSLVAYGASQLGRPRQRVGLSRDQPAISSIRPGLGFVLWRASPVAKEVGGTERSSTPSGGA